MDESVPNLFQGNRMKETIPVSSKSGHSEGDLVALRVKQSGAGKSYVEFGGREIQLDLKQVPREGTTILARFHAGAETGDQLNLLQTQQQFREIRHQELMKLLQRFNLPPTRELAEGMKEQLIKNGYFNPDRARTSLPSSSATPIRSQLSTLLQQLGLPVTAGAQKNLEQAVSTLRNLSTQELLQILAGPDLDLSSAVKGQPSQELVNQADQLINRFHRKGTDSKWVRNFNQLVTQLNLEKTPGLEALVKGVLNRHDQLDGQQLIRRIQWFSQVLQDVNQDQLSNQLKVLLDLLSTKSTPVEGTDSLSAQLQELGFSPRDSLKSLARVLQGMNQRLDPELLRFLIQNQSRWLNTDGSPDQARVQQLTALFKSLGVIPEELLDRVGKLKNLQTIQNLMNQFSGLNVVDGSRGDLANQLQQIVHQLGFNFERQLSDNPAAARETVRAGVQEIIGKKLETAADLKSTLQQGPPQPPGQFGQGEARDMMSQILKHALASALDDDRVYLFIPVKDGDRVRVMQVRYEDEREDKTSNQDKWTVTVQISLSKLGDIKVKARRRMDQIKVRFESERHSTVRLLRDHRRMLSRALDEMGFESTVESKRLENPLEDLAANQLLSLGDDTVNRLDFRV